MKIHFKKIFSHCAAILLAIAALDALPLQARPVTAYAESSALASGKWVKIKVAQSGMQFVSNTQLSAMGFADPTKVNVYGFGGPMIKEVLDDSHPDDLPLLPSVRTAAGLVFFGVNNIDWAPSPGVSNYTHTMHPYSEDSYYFLSDVATEEFESPRLNLRDIADLETADSFIERLVHEQELVAPGVSGRTLLGEDLRGNNLQLNFPLPGNVGGDASVTLNIGSNISGSTGQVKFTSNNATLNRNALTVEPVRSSEQFLRTNETNLIATKCGETLNLGLGFSTSGAINLIRLDYAEVEYERSLRLADGQLYFYFNEPVDVAAKLKGLGSGAEIWDVTVRHAPKKVDFNLSGDQATFRIEAGYREFVAFNPQEVKRVVEAVGEVANQDLHSLESPDLLIISPEEYIAASNRVAAMHREKDGMTVHVLTPAQIYNEFSSGTPDVSAFRKIMKMWYDRDMAAGAQKLKYCLIMSRPTYDNKMLTPTVKNAGYPRVPIWQSPSGFTDNTSYSTDDFIGMLEDQTSLSSMASAKINVAVGRFPVRSAEEAMTAVDKLLAYTNDPGKASWRNSVMIVADDQDSGQHLAQAEKMYENMMSTEKGQHYQYERLYLDNFKQQLTSVGMEYPEAKKRLLSKLEEGQSMLGYIGHANTVSWTHEHLLTWGDFTSLSNTRLPILYAATCEFARWDTDEYSGAEVIWAFPKTGIIATICPSRAVFINMNGPLSAEFGKYALIRNADGSPTRLGDTFRNMKNGISGSDDNKLRYALIGDPAMKMPVYNYNVEAKELYGVDLTSEDSEIPVIEARSNPVVKGEITDAEGNLIEDFNGFVYIKLYDAEKVIETLGNGDDGVVMMYNDRTTKLYDGVTKVENGKWETVIYMPSEIENNYTQGRMTYYALADDGREANGATEKFYVYGFDENAPEDNDGPEILYFYLNNERFKDGDVSYKTPVAYAAFSDDSGINLSDAGIGHALMLTLDDKVVYDDIMNFYAPDLFDSRKGSITYQMPELSAGKHALKLTVWDCANNSSSSTIYFNVAAVKDPDIYDISTSFNADTNGVEFIISSDRPMAALTCELEIFDINGVRVWHTSTDDRTASDSTIKLSWNYHTTAGNRVAKGIYICRATVITPEGKSTRKAKKIVLTQ